MVDNLERYKNLLTPIGFSGCNKLKSSVSRSGERQYVCYETDVLPNTWYELAMRIIGPTRIEIFFCGSKAFDSGWLISSDFDQTLEEVRNIYWPICSPSKIDNCVIANIIITTYGGLVPIMVDNEIQYVEPSWTMDFHEIVWINKPETSCHHITHDPRKYLLNGKKVRYPQDIIGDCLEIKIGDLVDVKEIEKGTYCWVLKNIAFHKLHFLKYQCDKPVQIHIYSCDEMIAQSSDYLEESEGERYLEFCPHFFCTTLKIVLDVASKASFKLSINENTESLTCNTEPYTSAPLYAYADYIDFPITEGFVGLSPDDAVYKKFSYLYHDKRHELLLHPYKQQNEYGPQHIVKNDTYKDLEMYGPYFDMKTLKIFHTINGINPKPFIPSDYLTKMEPIFPKFSEETEKQIEQIDEVILPYAERVDKFLPESFELNTGFHPESINDEIPFWEIKHWIMVVQKGIDHDLFEREISEHGIKIIHDYEHLDHYVIDGTDEQIENLKLDDRIVVISKNSQVSMTACHEEALTLTWEIDHPTHNWGLYAIAQLDLSGYPNKIIPNQKYAWSKDGFGVDVVILDSGINFNHTEFNGLKKGTIYDVRTDSNIQSSVPFYTPIDKLNPNYGMDCCGHGTHISGIIGGNKYGVAKGANLYSAKVFIKNTTTQEYYSENIWVLHALNAIVSWHKNKIANHINQPSIINISVGTDDPSTISAFQNCIDAGIVICSAAGNNNQDLAERPLYPAIISDALTVGAIDPELMNYLDENGNFIGVRNQVAKYSNYGEIIDVFAPGTMILSADYSNIHGGKVLSGTSQAAPFVTGVLAQWLQGRNIAVTNKEAKEANKFIAEEGSVKDNIILLDKMIPTTKNLLLISPYVCTAPTKKTFSEMDTNIKSVKAGQIRNRDTSPSDFTNVCQKAGDDIGGGGPDGAGPVFPGYGVKKSAPYSGGQNFNVDNTKMQIRQSNESDHDIVNHAWDPKTIVKKDAYKTNSYEIWVKDASDANIVNTTGHKGNVLEFEIVFNDDHSDRAYYDNVTGTVSSSVYLQKSSRLLGVNVPTVAAVSTPADPYVLGGYIGSNTPNLGGPDPYNQGGMGGGGGGGNSDTTDYGPTIIFVASFLDQRRQTTIIANWESTIQFDWEMHDITAWTSKTEIIGGICYYQSNFPNKPFDWFPIKEMIGSYTTTGALPICMRGFNGCELRITISAYDKKTNKTISAHVDIYLTTVCKCPSGSRINILNNTCESAEFIDPYEWIGPYYIIPTTIFNYSSWCTELQEYGIWISEDAATPRQLLYRGEWLAIGVHHDVTRTGTYTFEYSVDNEAQLWINGVLVDDWSDYTVWHSYTQSISVGAGQYFEFRFRNDLQAQTDFQTFTVNPGAFGAIILDELGNQIFNTRTSVYNLATFVCPSNYVPDTVNPKCYRYSATQCLTNSESLDCNAYLPSWKMNAYGWKLSDNITGTSSFGAFGERQLTYRGNRPKIGQVIGQKFFGSTGWSVFDPSVYLQQNPDVDKDMHGKVYGYFYTPTDHFIDHGAFEGLFGRCFSATNVAGPAYKCPCITNDDTNRNWGWRWNSKGQLQYKGRKATPNDVEGALFNTTIGPQIFRGTSFAKANVDVVWVLNDSNFGNNMHGNPMPDDLRYLTTETEYFIEIGSWESVAYGRCLNYGGNEVRDVGGYVDDYHNQTAGWSLMKHPKIKGRFLAYKYQKASHKNVYNGVFWNKHLQYEKFDVDEYLRINPDLKNVFSNGRWLDGRPLPKNYTPTDHFIDYGAWEGQFYRNFNG